MGWILTERLRKSSSDRTISSDIWTVLENVFLHRYSVLRSRSVSQLESFYSSWSALYVAQKASSAILISRLTWVTSMTHLIAPLGSLSFEPFACYKMPSRTALVIVGVLPGSSSMGIIHPVSWEISKSSCGLSESTIPKGVHSRCVLRGAIWIAIEFGLNFEARAHQCLLCSRCRRDRNRNCN